jgi:hypothetical protein
MYLVIFLSWYIVYNFMSVFNILSNGDSNVDSNKSSNEIKIGRSYTINGHVYLCFYIGTAKYSYPGYVAESDVAQVQQMEQEDIKRFDFFRLGTSTDNDRFLSIKEQDLDKYTIEEYSPAEGCTIMGGKKKSRKSKGSKKSRGKGSKKSRGKGSKKSRRSK